MTRNAVRVPQRQEEAAHDLVARSVAEAQVRGGVGRRVHPAHDVGADAAPRPRRTGSSCPSTCASPRRARRGAGRSAKSVSHRRRAGHHRRLGEERVEPVAELAGERLGDPVGRDTTPPSTRGRCSSSASRGRRCPASSHGLPTSVDAARQPPQDAQAISTPSIHGRCGECPSNASQPADRALPAARPSSR